MPPLLFFFFVVKEGLGDFRTYKINLNIAQNWVIM